MIFTNPDFFLLFLPFTRLGFHGIGYFGRGSAIGFLALIVAGVLCQPGE